MLILKSILPFIAIALFLLALVSRKRSEALLCFSAASGWLLFAGYCCLDAEGLFATGEYFDASMTLVFLIFAVTLAILLLTTKREDILLLFSAFTGTDTRADLDRGVISEELKSEFRANRLPAPGSARRIREHEWLLAAAGGSVEYIAKLRIGNGGVTIYKNCRIRDILFTVTKIAFITAVLYFPFAEIPSIGDALIFLTAKLTTLMINQFGFDYSVYLVPPSYIYTTNSAFHALYKPVKIILACTAIQSMVLFTGLAFGVAAPLKRALKAFMVSVPVIYGLNLIRNVFVCEAYFGEMFGAPAHSFYVAHGVIARIGVFISLVIIAYAVFVILPEALELVEDFLRVITCSSRRLRLYLSR